MSTWLYATLIGYSLRREAEPQHSLNAATGRQANSRCLANEMKKTFINPTTGKCAHFHVATCFKSRFGWTLSVICSSPLGFFVFFFPQNKLNLMRSHSHWLLGSSLRTERKSSRPLSVVLKSAVVGK